MRCSIRADPRDALDTGAARPLREAQHLFPRDLAAVGRAVYRLVDPAAYAQSRIVRKAVIPATSASGSVAFFHEPMQQAHAHAQVVEASVHGMTHGLAPERSRP